MNNGGAQAPCRDGSSRIDDMHCSKVQDSISSVGRSKRIGSDGAIDRKLRVPAPTLPTKTPSNATPKQESERSSDFLLRVQLRQTDGSFPPFPAQMLSQTHPLNDVAAHRKREKENFKRHYLRAVRRFTRRLKRMPTLNPRMQAPHPHSTHPTSLTVKVPTAQGVIDSGTNASISMFNNRSSQNRQKIGGSPVSTTGDTASATVASLLIKIRAEIRLVVRRILVANLRARRGKVKRVVFNSIVEETTDAVFVHWQETTQFGVPVREFLSVSACQIHTAIDKHLDSLFASSAA